jgi:hypothetical protein
MTAKQVTELTVEEFKAMIIEVVDERIKIGKNREVRQNKRSVREVLDSIASHRWMPPPGSPSVVEMLREDRHK